MAAAIEQLLTPANGFVFAVALALGFSYDQAVARLGRKRP